MKVVTFARVSTTSGIQDYTRQTEELKEYSARMGWDVVKIFQEKISGAKKNEERPVLLDMVDYIKKNKIDKVLTWEISRIGRNSIEVLKTLQLLNEHGISLFIKNYNIETLNDKGEINPLSHFMVQILNSVAEMERTTIRQRMKSGYDHYRKINKVGRKTGYRKDKEQLISEHKDVVKLIKQDYPVRKIMGLTGKSSGTVQKIKKLMSENKSK